jgi:prophage antirepressor-like protein
MTQDVTKFDFGLGSESFQIRVIDHNGEPWWVLADVCQVLGMGNPSHAASRLDDDERAICNSYRLKSSHITKGDRGKNLRDLIIISESGLYSIILRSNRT